MIKDVANIIESIVNQMDNTIEGNYNSGDGKTYFCKTKWARVGKPIFDALNNEYLITEVVLDDYIVATPVGHANDLDGVCSLVNPFCFPVTIRGRTPSINGFTHQFQHPNQW